MVQFWVDINQTSVKKVEPWVSSSAHILLHIVQIPPAGNTYIFLHEDLVLDLLKVKHVLPPCCIRYLSIFVCIRIIFYFISQISTILSDNSIIGLNFEWNEKFWISNKLSTTSNVLVQMSLNPFILFFKLSVLRFKADLLASSPSSRQSRSRVLLLVVSSLELETKVHPKVRNHGEGPY